MNSQMELEYIGTVPIYLGIGIQVIFALVLGSLIGLDREIKMKAAGFKTNILICLGATLYTTISLINLDGSSSMIDPNRVSAQIVSGIGFLGAGAIIQSAGGVRGMTTAATIWVVAAIGYTIGVGYPLVATIFTLTVLIVLKLLAPLQRIFEGKKEKRVYHFEFLTRGNFEQSLNEIIQYEQLENFKIFKEKTDGNNTHFFHLYIETTPKKADQIMNDIEDRVNVVKASHFEVQCIPENNDSGPLKKVAL